MFARVRVRARARACVRVCLRSHSRHVPFAASTNPTHSSLWPARQADFRHSREQKRRLLHWEHSFASRESEPHKQQLCIALAVRVQFVFVFVSCSSPIRITTRLSGA